MPSEKAEFTARGLSVGDRVRALREARGMTRAVLAGLCGRGPDWLKKIETGERELDSYTLLLRLAAALQLTDLSALTGEESVTQPVPLGRLNHPAMPDIWAAVMMRGLAGDTPQASNGVPDVAELRGRVDQTWRLWHTSRRNRTEVGALLPALIRDAEAASRNLDGAERRAALVALSDTYRLVGQATAYVAPAELAWVVADRALAAAQQADDPVAIAAAAWNMGNILRETSYPEEALRTVTEAADLLRPLLDDTTQERRGVYGALQLHAAVTCAREGREGDAWRHWDEGERVARSLPDTYVHPSTVFGRANVDFHAVSVATDLRTSGRALSLADTIDPDTMPSTERRARLWVEIARGHLQRGDATAALHVMQRAHAVNTETVRYTPAARTATADLWRRAPRALRTEASELASAVGVAVA
ncbi:helix-turn-helix domain-containing protein [Streptomyces albus subsp. chlorinus]|uniref:helix-turn-helix domain-containing protein n=1 Tax=Streptomyces albus TaxID=1888 RepID=UPI00156DE9ED|nr:helix-turn-helix transcriptional regulator [Streptomyces albus]NSC22825.1 helix-turn-helix domain-containing protein [Streptomyces albus subsp. chlorinus]